MVEPFTVTAGNETWTRSTKTGAIALANNIACVKRIKAVVTLTETGWVEHTAEPNEEV